MSCSPDSWGKLKDTRHRLEKCWKTDIDWSLYPDYLRDGCERVGKALNLPSTAILCGYIVIGSCVLSPSIVKVPGTDWSEPVLVWLTVSMPTGSGKSTLFKHLYSLLNDIRAECGVSSDDPSWVFDDGTFEKMGALMSENSCRLIGFYDELSAFLTQINLYRGRGLSDSHEMALFLQLYNGHPWRRDTISGDANFVMSSTMLTVGGCTQPGVARSLIEMPSNSDKGLTHRFLWLFLNPLFEKFCNLGEVDKGFVRTMVKLLAKQWRKPETKGEELLPRVFHISDEAPFGEYYDDVQAQLKSMAGFDELLSGMLSKSRGQVLRVATVLHVLFNPEASPLPDQISDAAVKAAVNLVKVANQQTAYMAGRKTLEEELEKCRTGDYSTDVKNEEDSTAGYCLTLPGRKLYLTPLLSMKKFRKRGNKDGAIAAFYQLEAEGLGKVVEILGSKGTSTYFEFEKAEIPLLKEDKLKIAKKLSKYNMSLTQYEHILSQREIKPMTGVKRTLSLGSDSPAKKSCPATVSPRRSPRNTPNSKK